METEVLFKKKKEEICTVFLTFLFNCTAIYSIVRATRIELNPEITLKVNQ